MKNLIHIITEKCASLDRAGVASHKLVTFLNPYSYLLSRKNPDILREFDTIYCDGIVLIIFLRLFGVANVKRAGFDTNSVLPPLADKLIRENKSIYFIGSKESEIVEALKNIKKLYPELNIAGYRNGYFDGGQEIQNVINTIKELSPDVVVAGLGTPFQEEFLFNLRKSGWKGTGYTCGGFFHQTAKKACYFPKWIDKLNLRWVYRIFHEKGLIKRYLIEYPPFVFYFIKDWLSYKFEKNC